MTALFIGLPCQRFVAAEGRVSVEELVVVNSVISDAEASKGPIGESADLTIGVIHEQVGEAVGEAMVEHAPRPMAHVSLFHATHDVNFLSGSNITCVTSSTVAAALQMLWGIFPAQMNIREEMGVLEKRKKTVNILDLCLY